MNKRWQRFMLSKQFLPNKDLLLVIILSSFLPLFEIIFQIISILCRSYTFSVSLNIQYKVIQVKHIHSRATKVTQLHYYHVYFK